MKAQVTLSTELRLLEQPAARLLKLVETDLPEPESTTTVRARAAWSR